MYKKYNFDGVIVENMHDIPYVCSRDSGPEVLSVMTAVCVEVKKLLPNIACGVQILAAMNREALAVAFASGMQFIRSEAYVFSHVADEGLMNACCGPLLRYRKHIGAESILVFTDIKKKHCSHAITADVTIKQTAEAAKFFLADGVIVTGSQTAESPIMSDVDSVLQVSDMPVLIGSGITSDNLTQFLQRKVNALIIGSEFKRNGLWSNEIDEQRISRFVDLYNTHQN
ncbi:uncharacterized protein B4U80_00137 [Leptotrombidium deliense]|uniref:Uncharacterized protein n=1 Tax=Leptotrombidium deliense TaxID=299467 RepID=A0A443RVI8_9ACAR|nr:uncharacterized protein B4U80_00137 [Leptotrombidium deliense]